MALDFGKCPECNGTEGFHFFVRPRIEPETGELFEDAGARCLVCGAEFREEDLECLAS